jgi:ketosteroid isomerase-like protein
MSHQPATSPSDPKRILTEANSAVTRGDYEGFLAHCTDDVRWTFVGDQVLEGKQAIREYIAKTYLEPPRFTVTQLIAEADTVAALGEIELQSPSGQCTRYEYCDVWRVRDGKLAELRAYVVEVG